MNHLGCFREVQESERSYVGPSGERMALNDLHKSGSLSRERPHAGRGFYVRHGAHIETHRHRNRTSVELYVILASDDWRSEHNIAKPDRGYKYLHRRQCGIDRGGRRIRGYPLLMSFVVPRYNSEGQCDSFLFPSYGCICIRVAGETHAKQIYNVTFEH